MAKNVMLGTGTTIGLWVKTTFSGSQAPFVSNRNGSPSGSIYFGIGSGHLFLYDSGTPSTADTSTSTIDDGAWHYVAVTMTSTTMTLYIDGVGTAESRATNSTSGALQLGHDVSTGNYFPGSLAQVRIYNRALNPNEVTALYNEAGNGINTDTAEAGLVGEWKLNGNAKDSTPYSNNGTLVNAPTPTTGPQGQANGAYNFSTTNQQIDVTDNQTISGTFSVAVWAKPAATNNDDAVMGSREGSNGASFDIQLLNGNTIHGDIGNGGSWLTTAANATFSYTAGQWYHIVYVVTPTGYTIYADGVQVGSGSYSGTPLFNKAGDKFGIGDVGAPGGQSYTGSIADVRIYNRALSASDVTNLYTSGSSQITLDVGGTNNPAQNINLTQGLVAYYPFNDNAKDATPYSDNGTVSNATLTTDRFGNANSAYSFNGTNATITLPTNNIYSFDRTTPFSIGAWVKTSSASQQTIFSKMPQSAPYTGYEFSILPGGNLLFYLINTYSSNMIQVSTTATVDNGQWHYVAVTYNGSSAASGVTIYIDGVAASTTTTYNSLTGTIVNALAPHIGSRNNTGFYFNGSIDEVRVYNRALSTAEVSALYSED